MIDCCVVCWLLDIVMYWDEKHLLYNSQKASYTV